MRGTLAKQLSKVRLIRFHKKQAQKYKPYSLDCSVETSSTEFLLAQLQEAQQLQITHLTLHDLLQRPDNVRVFYALQTLAKCKNSKLRHIRLIEPRVKAEDYRRWSFKKTGFLHSIYKMCQEDDEKKIEVDIQATLILETPQDQTQDISSWLSTHFPKTIPQDSDITTLKICMHDVKPNPPPEGEQQQRVGGKRRSRTPSEVEQVFQGLIGALNSGDCRNRAWQFIHCHVLYTTVPKYAVPQTEALLEVAQHYDIPLQVHWQPLDETKKAHGTWVRNTTRASQIILDSNSLNSDAASKRASSSSSSLRQRQGYYSSKSMEDSVTEFEGSSGHLMMATPWYY